MNLLDAIGNTPLVELKKISPRPEVRIFVKLEYCNPGCSIKDRIVKYIVEDAELSGMLKAGGTIVENTSGNTGAAAAMIASLKGYKAILTMPDKVSKEKQDALKAYGAEIVICPTSAAPDDPAHYVNKARVIAEGIKGAFRINQYDNPKNPEAHYLSTGPEIWEQTGGKIDYFVAAGSTGGTVSGVGRFLKEKNSKVKIVMPDPIGSIYYEYWKTGKVPEGGSCLYNVEGVGEDHLAKAMDFSVVDLMYQFNDKDAFLTARRVAREEGIMGGGSSGANIWAALKLAAEIEGPATIVTVISDSGVKYLSKMYDDAWMRAKGFM